MTRVKGISRAVGGWSSGQFLPLRFGGASFEAKAIVSGFEDMAVVGQPIEQGRGHFGVAEYAGPFREAEVGGDHHAGLLVKLGEQMEQKRAS